MQLIYLAWLVPLLLGHQLIWPAACVRQGRIPRFLSRFCVRSVCLASRSHRIRARIVGESAAGHAVNAARRCLEFDPSRSRSRIKDPGSRIENRIEKFTRLDKPAAQRTALATTNDRRVKPSRTSPSRPLYICHRPTTQLAGSRPYDPGSRSRHSTVGNRQCEDAECLVANAVVIPVAGACSPPNLATTCRSMFVARAHLRFFG